MAYEQTDYNSNRDTIDLFTRLKYILNEYCVRVSANQFEYFDGFLHYMRVFYINLQPVLYENVSEIIVMQFDECTRLLRIFKKSGHDEKFLMKTKTAMINLYTGLLQKYQEVGLGVTKREIASRKERITRAFKIT